MGPRRMGVYGSCTDKDKDKTEFSNRNLSVDHKTKCIHKVRNVSYKVLKK